MSVLILFEEKQVRRVWDEAAQKWYFAIVDVIAVLTDSVDPAAYWRKLKESLKKEGNETVTNCHGLKMKAADGKMRFTDARRALEQQTGAKIVSSENYTELPQRAAKKLKTAKSKD
jgi:hypothetical protein